MTTATAVAKTPTKFLNLRPKFALSVLILTFVESTFDTHLLLDKITIGLKISSGTVELELFHCTGTPGRALNSCIKKEDPRLISG